MWFENDISGLAEILFIPKSRFTAADVPDLTGKVIIVTGGNTGIGKETAKVLLEHNAKVYIACRSAEKGSSAVEDLVKVTGKSAENIKLLQMDLANLPTIKAGVDEFLRQESRLDVLLNSAGVMWIELAVLTAHGHDMQFGTNVLGHFYLTQLLLPTLLSTAASSPDKQVRIVNLSSNGHWGAPVEKVGGPIKYETLVPGAERDKMGSHGLYYQSKAGDILFTNALARKYGDRGIVSISVNPGSISSDLARHTAPWARWILKKVLYPVSQGAITSLYAGTSPDAARLNGKYLVPWARLRHHRRDLESVEHQEKLWSWCEEATKEFLSDVTPAR